MSYYQYPMGDYKTYGYGGDPGFLSKLWKGVKKVAPIVAGIATGGVATGMGAAVAKAGLPAVIGRTLPAVIGAGKKMTPILKKVGPIATGVGVGMLVDEFGRPVRKKSRRMNPCNDKALRRALRRIESYDRLRKRVDKSLRKACPPRRAARPATRACK